MTCAPQEPDPSRSEPEATRGDAPAAERRRQPRGSRASACRAPAEASQTPLTDFIPDLPPPRVRLRDADDLIAMVPYLLGFHPEQSLVICLADHGTIRVTARVDVTDVDVAQLRHVHSILTRGLESPQAFLLAYARDRDQAEEALGLAEVTFGDMEITESVLVVGQRYWSRHCGALAGCPSGGHQLPLRHNPVATQAVLAGMAALPGRESLDELVAGPSDAELPLCCARVRRLRPSAGRGGARRLDELLGDGLAGRPLSADERCELGLLVGDIVLRDRAWLRMSRQAAAEHLNLWLSVVQVLPEREAVSALALTAVAAWLTGNGALEITAVQRGLSIDPDCSMLRLLDQMAQRGAPPSLWDQMSGASSEAS